MGIFLFQGHHHQNAEKNHSLVVKEICAIEILYASLTENIIHRTKMIKNKKADSQMVSYVLLVVIAISLSAAVFAFLKLYVPSDREKCPDDVSVIIEEVICSQGKLNLAISNRGLFNVSMLFVRMGEESRTVRTQINNKTELLPEPLAPGQTNKYLFNIPTRFSTGTYIVEVQPAILSEKKNLRLCSTIPTQKVIC